MRRSYYENLHTNMSPILDLSRNKYEKPIYYTDEIWVPVSNLVVDNILPFYSVSNYGRIYSGIYRLIMRQAKDKDGYLKTSYAIYDKDEYGNCKRIMRRTNRVVMISFCPIDGYENLIVHHKNGIRDDNRLCNLEWCTAKENTMYSIEMGTFPENPNRKLTDEDISKIVELVKSQRYSYVDIANILDISPSTIGRVVDKCISNGMYNISNNNIRLTNAFTNYELEEICRFFENNKSSFLSNGSSKMDLYRACFDYIGISDKYDVESKRCTLDRLLDKSVKCHSSITNKYQY